MSRHRFRLGYVLAALAAGAGLLYLDAIGVFIYLGHRVPLILRRFQGAHPQSCWTVFAPVCAVVGSGRL